MRCSLSIGAPHGERDQLVKCPTTTTKEQALRETHPTQALHNCELLTLPKISDPRGNLTFIESHNHIPFEIRRAYYLYDVPSGSERGGHAHKALHQLIIPLAGSFDIVLDDGESKKTLTLNRPWQGLYICPMIWRELENFSSGSVCMVLASEKYDECDYYRDYQEFIHACKQPI